MHVLWRVIVKEFLQIRRDRRMIPVIFVAPVVQILVFGFAVNTDVTDVRTVLVDQDRGAASRDLVSRRLQEREAQLAGTLSGGEQQMLAIGRALMARPKLIMMDEPSMGLAPLIVKDIFSIIRKLREEGNTVLLVEQNAKAALKLSHRGYVLENRAITLQGRCEDLLHNEKVRHAYLGE